MKVTYNPGGKSIIGISGHAGVGHAHSHCGFVQDDSAGFAVAIEILKKAFPLDTRINSVSASTETGRIIVETKSGGTGSAIPRRGITPYEQNLLQQALNMDAAYSHTAAFEIFGRIYGQGVMETPVSFQAACCLAVIDSFKEQYPHLLTYGVEDMPGKIGGCVGARLDIDEISVSVMALVNASKGGVGPEEDLEGNVMLGDKGRAMKELGLDRLPTIVLESKAYVPSLCQGVDHDRMWIRINKAVDNTYVYDALLKGVQSTGLPYLAGDTAYPRHTGEMTEAVEALGKRIAELGTTLSTAKTSAEKVRLISELALIASQDAGGVSFMSSDMHDQVGGGGIMPGTSAVLNMTVSEDYINKWKIPAFDSEDAEKYLDVIKKALPELANNADNAQKQLSERFSFNEKEHDHLF